jgi:hypothetical protein
MIPNISPFVNRNSRIFRGTKLLTEKSFFRFCVFNTFGGRCGIYPGKDIDEGWGFHYNYDQTELYMLTEREDHALWTL